MPTYTLALKQSVISQVNIRFKGKGFYSTDKDMPDDTN